MSPTRRTTLALALVAASLAAGGASAQEPGGAPPAPPPTAPRADPAQILDRMAELHARAMRQPTGLTVGGGDADKARVRLAKETAEWDSALRELSRLGDEYLTAIGSGPPDARALYFRGVGKALLATRQSRGEAEATRAAAAESLRRFLGEAPADAAFRADAELHLGRLLVFASASDEKSLDEAVAHLRRAVDLLRADRRADDAGEAAYTALSELVGRGREADAQAFAKAVGARDGDFGASTPSVRRLAALTLVVPGGRLPTLPDVTDADGKAVKWAELAGKPFLVHFFKAGEVTGRPTGYRDVETELLPLWTKYRDRGLLMVGVSMDYLQPKEKAEEMRRNWKEWGVKGEYHDGSLEAVRAWVKDRGIQWPWTWDGKWMNNPVSQSLGGVGVNSPFAILVDRSGVIRWRGAPTPSYDGLADEAAKLFAK